MSDKQTRIVPLLEFVCPCTPPRCPHGDALECRFRGECEKYEHWCDLYSKFTSVKEPTHKRARKVKDVDSPPPHAFTLADLQDLELTYWHWRIVRDKAPKLPKRQRECLYLRYWKGVPVKEIAKRLHISHQAVTIHLQRAHQTIYPYLMDVISNAR